MTEALALCRASLAEHSKSFALATRLLPAATGDRAAVIYAWCRRADDAVDLVAADAAPAAVSRLANELAAIATGQPLTDPVLASFAAVVAETGIPLAYPRALLAGMAMDARGARYATIADVLDYSYNVASSVGLMMCHVFGVRDDRALRRAAHLGIAMQLTNICRDVAEDWERGRVYLPAALVPGLVDRLGAPLAEQPREPIVGAIRELLALADRYYASGDRGIAALPWRAGVGVRAARRIYAAIGDVIRANNCDPVAGRAVVSRWRKRRLAGRAIARQVVALPAHGVRRLAGRVPRPPREVVEARDVVGL